MPLQIVGITRTFARDILTWRYDPPYDIYNIAAAPERTAAAVDYFLAPENHFCQIELDGHAVAFCSFGNDGRVPGGDYRDEALDIGLGLRPNMTGRRFGAEIVGTVIAHARQVFAPPALRVTVAAFNVRALRVWQSAGFSEANRFEATASGLPFVVLIRTEG